MENENKNLQNEETVLTPEEKVQLDISEKIADAAAEIQEEIADASDVQEEVIDEVEEIISDATEEIVPEKKLTRNTFIASLIGAAVIGALVASLIFGIGSSSKSNASLIEKSSSTLADATENSTVVATVGDKKITSVDLSYYINAEASTYANQNALTEEDLKTYDWNQEIDGVKLSDKLVNAALENAINDALTIQKGAEHGITLAESDQYSIMSQIYGMLSSYGKDGLMLRLRTMGIPSVEQYGKMYENVMLTQQVSADIDADPSKYYPEDTSVLNDYIQDGKASVKHILISTEAAEAEEGAEPVDKKALAEEVLLRAQNGEDFDALIAEFNEDPGATEAGYTFTKGTMVAEFEDAAFALKIGEMSGLVETQYGYHIIKRIPGLYELQGMWKEDAKVSVKKSAVKKLSVAEIMKDMADAITEVNAAQAQ